MEGTNTERVNNIEGASVGNSANSVGIMSTSRYVMNPNVEGSASSHPPKELGKDSLKAIMCVSTCPLLRNSGVPAGQNPFAATDISGTALGQPRSFRKAAGSTLDTVAESPQLFRVSPSDVKRLLQTLSKWQQENNARAVLLVGCGGAPGVDMGSSLEHSEAITAHGWVTPFALSAEGAPLIGDAAFEDPKNVLKDIWVKGRSSLAQLILGQMDRRTAARSQLTKLEDVLLLSHHGSNSSWKIDTSGFSEATIAAQYIGSLERASIWLRRSFWDVQLVPWAPAIPPPQSEIGGSSDATWLAPERCAAFSMRRITDTHRSAVCVVVGPVIGRVSAYSALILLETLDDGHVEMICTDQVTAAVIFLNII